MDSSNSLTNKKCIPCNKGAPPLQEAEVSGLLKQLGNDWQVIDNHHLEKEYHFKNFREALAFTNKVGELAEIEGHHPDIHLSWGKVKIILWTHKINGLSENDFILAAKCDTK